MKTSSTHLNYQWLFILGVFIHQENVDLAFKGFEVHLISFFSDNCIFADPSTDSSRYFWNYFYSELSSNRSLRILRIWMQLTGKNCFVWNKKWLSIWNNFSYHSLPELQVTYRLRNTHKYLGVSYMKVDSYLCLLWYFQYFA